MKHAAGWLLMAGAGLLLSARALIGGDLEPLPVTVFYSTDDPHWKDARAVIADSLKPFGSRVALEEVSYDSADGYARLARVEKELPVDRPGEITAVAGRFALTSSGQRRDVENYIAPVIARLLGGENLKERLIAESEAFAARYFGPGTVKLTRAFEEPGGVFYQVTRDGTAVGWVVDAYRTIHCPVCYDAQMLVAVSVAPELNTMGIQPVRALEVYGRPLGAEQVARYLKQFEGQRPDSARTIDAIIGATKTSLAYEKTVVQILQTLSRRAAETGETRP